MAQDLYKWHQEALVGHLLYDPTEITPVLELVREDDFDQPATRLIFQTAAELSRQNLPVTVVTVGEHLETQGQLRAAGGMAGLEKLRALGKKASADAPILLYARHLKESSMKIKAKGTVKEAEKIFEEDSGHLAADGLSEVQNALSELQMALSDDTTVSKVSEGHNDYMTLLKQRQETSEANQGEAAGLQGIPSMWPSINKYTTGWLPGQMVTVGARTGVGKSIFAVDCALAAAVAGKAVMMFSLEMSSDEVMDRIYAATTSIPLGVLKQGMFKEDELNTLAEASKEIEAMNIIVDVEPKQTVDTIRARALKQAQGPQGLDFIIIDYLQLIQPVGRYGSRQEAVAEISRQVKLLAKQLQIPIMVLVQLNRVQEDEGDEILPRMEHIRESHAIAQDSDVVVLLHRPKTSGPEDTSTQYTLLILAKNRNGPADKYIQCHSLLECALFREVPRLKDVEGQLEQDFSSPLEEPDFDTVEGDILLETSGGGLLEDTFHNASPEDIDFTLDFDTPDDAFEDN